MFRDHRSRLTKVFFISPCAEHRHLPRHRLRGRLLQHRPALLQSRGSDHSPDRRHRRGAFIPLAGQLGSRIGSKRLLTASYIAYIALTFPSFMLMNAGSVSLAIFGLLLGMVPYALCQAGTYAAMPEFFPVEVRHTGVAFGHSVGAVLGGAGAPYVATWLIDSTGNSMIPAYMLIAFGLGLAVRRRGAHNNPLYPCLPSLPQPEHLCRPFTSPTRSTPMCSPNSARSARSTGATARTPSATKTSRRY